MSYVRRHSHDGRAVARDITIDVVRIITQRERDERKVPRGLAELSRHAASHAPRLSGSWCLCTCRKASWFITLRERWGGNMDDHGVWAFEERRWTADAAHYREAIDD